MDYSDVEAVLRLLGLSKANACCACTACCRHHLRRCLLRFTAGYLYLLWSPKTCPLFTDSCGRHGVTSPVKAILAANSRRNGRTHFAEDRISGAHPENTCPRIQFVPARQVVRDESQDCAGYVTALW